jgi:mRNA-degrading endonuclease RelE of RelBE toxin-antitoxin system
MRVVNLSRDAEKVLRRVPEEHRGQLASKLLALSENPRPNDAKKLVDSSYLRVTVGEYRVVYSITADAIEVVLLEKRDSVHKKLRRL